MSETPFTFRAEQDEEPSLPDSQRANASSGSSAGPLYLDRPYARTARRGRGFPVILASVLVFFAAAGAAALVLSPDALREMLSAFAPEAETPPAPPPPIVEPEAVREIQAPVAEPEASVEAAAVAASLAAADEPKVTAPPASEAVEPRPQPKAAPKPKPSLKTVAKAKPAAAKKPAPKAASLDLDALERSLPE